MTKTLIERQYDFAMQTIIGQADMIHRLQAELAEALEQKNEALEQLSKECPEPSQ